VRVVELATIQDVDLYTKRFRGKLGKSKALANERALLAEFRVYKWRGATVYGLHAGTLVTALCAVGFTRTHLNVYGLHTDPAFRRTGSMRVLLDHAEAAARKRGLARVKAKASSVEAVHLFAKRGWAAWAVTTKGEVLFDTFLEGEDTELPMGFGRGQSLVWGPNTFPVAKDVLLNATACPRCAKPIVVEVGVPGQRAPTCVVCWEHLSGPPTQLALF
jgi:GNAT superfamily N-acetyltransferase